MKTKTALNVWNVQLKQCRGDLCSADCRCNCTVWTLQNLSHSNLGTFYTFRGILRLFYNMTNILELFRLLLDPIVNILDRKMEFLISLIEYEGVTCWMDCRLAAGKICQLEDMCSRNLAKCLFFGRVVIIKFQVLF